MILSMNGDHFPVWCMESDLFIVKFVYSLGNEKAAVW